MNKIDGNPAIRSDDYKTDPLGKVLVPAGCYSTLKEAIEENKEKLAGASFIQEDLSGVDFSGANLRGAIFSHSNMERANFEKADLSGSIIHASNIKNADFTAANLSHAYIEELTSGQKEKAIFTGAVLRDAFLSTDLSFINFEKADLTGADLRGAKFAGTSFKDAILDGAKMDNNGRAVLEKQLASEKEAGRKSVEVDRELGL